MELPAPTPPELLTAVARSLARHGSSLCGMALHVSFSGIPARPRVTAAAASDRKISLHDPVTIDLSFDPLLLEALDHSIGVARIRQDAVPDAEWFSGDRRRHRAALGVHDYARAAARVQGAVGQEVIVVEITSRTADWLPLSTDASGARFAAELSAWVYDFRIARPARAREGLLALLTPAQRDIAIHLTAGEAVPDIAELFSRSPHTVQDHIKAIFRAWGVHSKTEALWLWKNPLERSAGGPDSARQRRR